MTFERQEDRLAARLRLSHLEHESVRRYLSSGGWKFRGYTSGLAVAPGGRVLRYMVQAKGCRVYFDPRSGEFMVQL